jgi:Fe2+ transport system protein FeoA
MVTCALCGFSYVPGGDSCREKGCPLSTGGCHLEHCPRCGYATPDAARGLAGWLGRLLGVATSARTATGARRITDLRPGAGGTIQRIDAAAGIADQLTLLGLAPGKRMTLQQRFPAFVVETDGSEVALEHEVAQTVWVNPDRASNAATGSGS